MSGALPIWCRSCGSCAGCRRTCTHDAGFPFPAAIHMHSYDSQETRWFLNLICDICEAVYRSIHTRSLIHRILNADPDPDQLSRSRSRCIFRTIQISHQIGARISVPYAHKPVAWAQFLMWICSQIRVNLNWNPGVDSIGKSLFTVQIQVSICSQIKAILGRIEAVGSFHKCMVRGQACPDVL